MKFLFLICLLTMVLESRATPAGSQMKVNFTSGKQHSVTEILGNPKMNGEWNDAPESTIPMAYQFSLPEKTKEGKVKRGSGDEVNYICAKLPDDPERNISDLSQQDQVAGNTEWFSVAHATKAALNLFNMDRLLTWKLSAGSFINVILKKSITSDQYFPQVAKQEFSYDNIVHTYSAPQTKNLTVNDHFRKFNKAKAMLKGSLNQNRLLIL